MPPRGGSCPVWTAGRWRGLGRRGGVDGLEVAGEAGIVHKRTHPYRPQTNGKVERFHRYLLLEWAYARPYPSETARRNTFATWLHVYNHHRPHTAPGGNPPISRVTNLRGQHTLDGRCSPDERRQGRE